MVHARNKFHLWGKINIPIKIMYLKISGGKISIPGGYSIGHSKEKIVHVRMSYSKRFTCIYPGSESVI
jgi:hypothetical protein